MAESLPSIYEIYNRRLYRLNSGELLYGPQTGLDTNDLVTFDDLTDMDVMAVVNSVNSQIIFNDGGFYKGDPLFVWDKTVGQLKIYQFSNPGINYLQIGEDSNVSDAFLITASTNVDGNGQAINITAGDPSDTVNYIGGDLNLTAGNSRGNITIATGNGTLNSGDDSLDSGGNLTITTGNSAYGPGGGFYLTTGDGSGGEGGEIIISTGSGSTTGGDITFNLGGTEGDFFINCSGDFYVNGGSYLNGGEIQILAGERTDGDGWDATLWAGPCDYTTGKTAGDIYINGGSAQNATVAGYPGGVYITAGRVSGYIGVSTNGADVRIAGTNTSRFATAKTGGSVWLTAGDGDSDGTNNSGGSILLQPGSAIGTGTVGAVRVYSSTSASIYVNLDSSLLATSNKTQYLQNQTGYLVLQTPSALTNTRVPFADSNGLLTDDADLRFATDTLTIGTAGATTGKLALAGSTSTQVTIQPLATAGNWTLTLPPDDGLEDQFLQTDGNGVTTWQSAMAQVAEQMLFYNNELISFDDEVVYL